jgi:phosphoglycolate phosphatase-like HAD superfamily hydrolase
MKHIFRFGMLFLVVLSFFIFSCTKKQQKQENTKQKTTITTDPLSSWNEGSSKKAIIDFVTKTTNEEDADFVPVADRIACFDNDGTLWSEQPMYFQMAFALNQIKVMAPQHPEWKTKQPYKAVLEGDLKTVMAGGEKSLGALMMATHAGMTTEAFDTSVKHWIKTATHPKTGKHYNEMTFLPMVELLNYLRANGYKTFIVSGGGLDFMRAWAEDAYGIPPYQVIGSSGEYKYEVKEGKGELLKIAELNFNDDKKGKPVGIIRNIGKRPVFTVGNSDGDYAMLQYTSTGAGPRFGMIVNHTDSIREVAYDRNSSIGKLNKGLNDAAQYNWLIVDIKKDWKKIYSFDK